MAENTERLEELVLLGQLDELLSLVTLEDLADAWCRYQSRPHIHEVDEEDPDEWAMLFVTGGGGIDDLDEPLVRALLHLLIERAPNENVLDMVGAGPLEDFNQGLRRGSHRVDRRARGCVCAVQTGPGSGLDLEYRTGSLRAVERAAGVPLARPDEDVILDIVPGELPGTVHITRNGVAVSEIETEPDDVEGTIERLRRYMPIRRTS